MSSLESSIITIENVTKKYNSESKALEEISLDVNKGEFVFLTGPSGSGKSTLLKLLFCAERPTLGNIWVDGMDLSSLTSSQVPFLRRKVGVIFQDFKLLPNHTVSDNVSLCLEVTGLKKEQVERRVRQVIDGVGLSDKLKRKAIQLSGGEQQRVAIARAVETDRLLSWLMSRLVILTEPEPMRL